MTRAARIFDGKSGAYSARVLMTASARSSRWFSQLDGDAPSGAKAPDKGLSFMSELKPACAGRLRPPERLEPSSGREAARRKADSCPGRQASHRSPEARAGSL